MDDSSAIQRLKKGDIGGLEFLIARHQVKAFRTAVLILNDDAMAEDVVHDTFLRIYQRIRYFDADRPFEPYLMRSIAHAALNAAEKASTVHDPGRGNRTGDTRTTFTQSDNNRKPG